MLSIRSLLNASFGKRLTSYWSTHSAHNLAGVPTYKEVIRMSSTQTTTMQEDVTNRLVAAFSPTHLAIENESYKHSVPKGSETHFKVIVVSEKFEGVPLIEQHRMVNDALADNLKSGVHALAIKTMTPKKWQALYESDPSAAIFKTPNCMGGSKHDKKSL